MSEVDPDPYDPAAGQVADDGDPTQGGKRGETGAAPSVTSDEPGDGASQYPVGGGSVGEEQDAPPVADPGPSA
ncbi:MAG: hypothetical protein ABWY29_09290 [Blastococcus sp.]